jgi:hypothetical protein
LFLHYLIILENEGNNKLEKHFQVVAETNKSLIEKLDQIFILSVNKNSILWF